MDEILILRVFDIGSTGEKEIWLRIPSIDGGPSEPSANHGPVILPTAYLKMLFGVTRFVAVASGATYPWLVLVEGAGTVPKILMLGANPLVRDNLLVLLTAMGCHCALAPSLKEARVLLEKAKPDAAILDPQADASPAGIVAAFHRRFPCLRDRTIVLTGEETPPEVLNVLDAYSLPRVPLHRFLQELWPCLDSLLTSPNVQPNGPLPVEWRPNRGLGVRVEKHRLFVKLSYDGEIETFIARRERVKRPYAQPGMLARHYPIERVAGSIVNPLAPHP